VEENGAPMLRAAVIVCAALAAAGCKKPEVAEPATAPPAPAAAPIAGAPPAEAPLAVDDQVVERFIKFDEQYLASLPQRMRAMRDELARVGRTSPGAGPADDAAAQAVLRRMNAEDAELRAKAGITQEQQQGLQDLAMAIA